MATDPAGDFSTPKGTDGAICPAISLTTDFGLQDEYVSAMKGVILSRLQSPATTQLVDICHQVPAQDVRSAAFLFGRAYPYFPAGTIHIVVIDPGVGSKRRILAIQSRDQVFVGPDNGVFTSVFHNSEINAAPLHAYEITNRQLFLSRVSSTFHGRDIMAPVAAALASGAPIHAVGSKLDPASCTVLAQQPKTVGGEALSGEVIHIDLFGNICTNLTADDLQPLLARGTPVITIGGTTITGLSDSYSASHRGELLAHFDSHFHLEIAVRDGSAQRLLKVQRGDRVSISRQ